LRATLLYPRGAKAVFLQKKTSFSQRGSEFSKRFRKSGLEKPGEILRGVEKTSLKSGEFVNMGRLYL